MRLSVMFPRRILAAVLVAMTLAGSAPADGAYLFDLLKQPTYRAAWTAMFKGEKGIDPWIATFARTYDGVATASSEVTVNGQSNLVAEVCKPHDCGGNRLYVLFAPGARQAWGLLVVDGASPRWFGKPGAAIRDALNEASQQ